jgi:hypothetical protein
MVATEQALRAELAVRDKLFWLQQCTNTKDEQDTANPYKPFPPLPYFKYVLDVLDYEPIVFLEKSRTMMCSWIVSGWAAHLAFTHPATCVVFQSEDEDRAVHDVEYCKTLWEQSPKPLQERWPLLKPLEKQPYNEMRLANQSRLIGIPGDPDKIRSEHPTCVVLDEAAHITEGEKSYNIAAATRCPHLICLSSANPGWFRDATEFATPVDWPEYGMRHEGHYPLEGRLEPEAVRGRDSEARRRRDHRGR